MLLSLLGLVWFARTRNVRALAGSFVAYALGLCTYELTYLMCFAMLGILAVELPWRRAVRLAAPYFILSFAVICLQVYVKAAAHMPADANYSVSPHASTFLVATAIQAVAAIPLTYLIINPAGVFASGAGDNRVATGLPHARTSSADFVRVPRPLRRDDNTLDMGRSDRFRAQQNPGEGCRRRKRTTDARWYRARTPGTARPRDPFVGFQAPRRSIATASERSVPS